jgi:predicted enzyme related to lactoylglutathione lyase
VSEKRLLGWPTWIGVVVEDVERQRHFWGDVVGLTEEYAGPDYVMYDMGGGRSFELIERSADPDYPQYDGLRFQVGFEVEDIEAARAELIRRGVEAITDIFPNDEAPWTYFRDPEGNVFALKQKRAR